MVCGNRRHEYGCKDDQLVYTKNVDEDWLSNCYLVFWILTKFWKSGKKRQKFYLKFPVKCSIVQKTLYVWSNTCRWIRIHNFQSISWKRPSFTTLNVRRPLFTLCIDGDFGIFSTLNFVRFGPFKKCILVSSFCIIDKKWPKICTAPTKPKIFSLTIFDLLTPDDLDLTRVTIG